MRTPTSENERIIEKVGAFDPLTEGFQTHGDMFLYAAPGTAR